MIVVVDTTFAESNLINETLLEWIIIKVIIFFDEYHAIINYPYGY